MKKVFIRVDGGEEIGMGHIMRMLTLANKLKSKCKVIFICRKDDKFITGINKIKDCGFCVIIIDGLNLVNEIVSVQKEINADCLITDSYDVDERYFDYLKSYFKRTCYMDDINICRLNVDIIINQNITAIDYNYNTTPNNECKLLLGTEYLLLRDEFRIDYARESIGEVKSVMITVGGMDDEFFTVKILELIKDFGIDINVIVGQAFTKSLVDILEIISKENKNVVLYKNAKMSDVMMKSNIAISTCGSTLYELCAMGVPTLGIVVADNQEEVARLMDEKELILNFGRLIKKNSERFKRLIRLLIKDKELRNKLIINGKKIVKKDGPERVAHEIVKDL